jgi:hypothetical protein
MKNKPRTLVPPQDLLGLPLATAWADYQREAASRGCSDAADPATVEQIVRERTADRAAFAETLRVLRKQFLYAHVPVAALADDAQVRDAAKMFSLIAATGELSITYGITRWTEGEAFRTAGACFRRWLDEYGQMVAILAVHRSVFGPPPTRDGGGARGEANSQS